MWEKFLQANLCSVLGRNKILPFWANSATFYTHIWISLLYIPFSVVSLFVLFIIWKMFWTLSSSVKVFYVVNFFTRVALFYFSISHTSFVCNTLYFILGTITSISCPVQYQRNWSLYYLFKHKVWNTRAINMYTLRIISDKAMWLVH